MKNKKSEVILPCPFCGGTPTVPVNADDIQRFADGLNWAVSCDNKKWRVKPCTNFVRYRHQAIKIWNRRLK